LNSYFYATEPFRNLDFNKYAIHHNTKDIENLYKSNVFDLSNSLKNL